MEMIEQIEEKLKLLPPEIIIQIDSYINNLLDNDKIETHLASQDVLSKEWSTNIEDEVWKNL